ncbi:molybdate ABC transporter substrate-binding protein [Dyella sp. KULCS107]|uniref:molybdate ABC transporter substrate-binding protein n=1 Tax=Dyella sp. KULCS107 TaxID=3422216 RepID=UPI003D6FCFE5
MRTPTLHRCLAVIAFAIAAVTGPARADDLVVSAASSLTNAFQNVAKAYEEQHPGTHVVLNFGSSDTLLRQIANGAPADVFASADQVAMNKAQSQGAITAGSRVDFAANQLVLIVPAGGAKVATLNDLTGAAFKRIAWGDPASVPVGRYTKNVLDRAGLTPRLQDRTVLAANVRQCLDYVVRGEVDAGFVYATDAAIARGKVDVALRVPSTAPITYPIAVVAQSKHAAKARDFIAFVRSTQGQQLLANAGFLAP